MAICIIMLENHYKIYILTEVCIHVHVHVVDYLITIYMDIHVYNRLVNQMAPKVKGAPSHLS